MPTSLPHCESFQHHPDPPYDAALTLNKPAGWDVFTPSEQFRDETLWSALTLEDAPTAVRIAAEGTVEDPVLMIDVYRQKSLSPDALERIVQKVNPLIDLSAFYAMASDDPVLSYPVNQHRGMHPTTGDSLCARAILAITLQQAPLQRSFHMRESVIDAAGTAVNFDDVTLQVQPTAATLATVSEATLRNECGCGYRAPYLRKMASQIAEGFISLEDLRGLSREAAREHLEQLPGIGPYSADIINPYRGCPIDSWSAEVFGQLLLDDDTAGVKKVKEAAEERWGKWDWLAFAYVVQDLKGLSEELGVDLRLQ